MAEKPGALEPPVSDIMKLEGWDALIVRHPQEHLALLHLKGRKVDRSGTRKERRELRVILDRRKLLQLLEALTALRDRFPDGRVSLQ